jgi:hypothetical protein
MVIVAVLSSTLRAATVDTATTISFYGLKPIGLPATLAQSLQEHLESTLLLYGRYDVLSRNDMDKILAEHRFQQAGVCSERECLVEAGAILGVDKIVTGTLSRVGSMYNVVLKLIDVGSGRLEYSVNEQYRGPVDSLLAVAEGAMQRLLVGPTPPREHAAAEQEPTDTSVTDSISVPHTREGEHEIATMIDSTSEERAAVPAPEEREPSTAARKLGYGAVAVLVGVAALVTVNAVR